MAEPPLLTGAFHLTVLEITPFTAVGALALTPVGALATTAAGVTALDAEERAPRPNLLTARTWKVYVVPLVSPVIVVLVASPATVLTTAPSTRISLLVIGAAAVEGGGVQVTVAWPWPAVATTFVGAAGAEIDWLVKALQTLVTGSLPVQNRRFSMFHSVSTPSPLANRSAAATKALSATVTLPSGLGVTV